MLNLFLVAELSIKTFFDWTTAAVDLRTYTSVST